MATGGRKPNAPTKDALRKRESRKRSRLAKAKALLDAERRPPVEASEPSDLTTVMGRPDLIPLNETVPVDAPGASAFVMGNTQPTVIATPSDEPKDEVPRAQEQVPAADAPADIPLVEPTPKPAAVAVTRPAVTEKDVAILGLMISGFFGGGANALLRKRPDMRASLSEAIGSAAPPPEDGTLLVTDPVHYVPMAKAFVYQMVVEVCIERNIRIPLQREIVIAFAVGIGAFGFIVKPDPNALASGNTQRAPEGNTTRTEPPKDVAPPAPPVRYDANLPPIGGKK